jgi:hypothetical protein
LAVSSITLAPEEESRTFELVVRLEIGTAIINKHILARRGSRKWCPCLQDREKMVIVRPLGEIPRREKAYHTFCVTEVEGYEFSSSFLINQFQLFTFWCYHIIAVRLNEHHNHFLLISLFNSS